MTQKNRRSLSWFLLLTSFVLIFLFILGVFSPPSASAAIQQITDANGQVFVRSQRSIRDSAEHPWQVVVFRYEKTAFPAPVILRLVGFPGVVELVHPQPLKMKLFSGEERSVPDTFSDRPPAPNVGQYDLTEILPELSLAAPLTLILPINTDPALKIVIYPTVLQEWKRIADSSDA